MEALSVDGPDGHADTCRIHPVSGLPVWRADTRTNLIHPPVSAPDAHRAETHVATALRASPRTHRPCPSRSDRMPSAPFPRSCYWWEIPGGSSFRSFQAGGLGGRMRNVNTGPPSLATARGCPHLDVWSFCGSDRPPPTCVIFSTQSNPYASEPLTASEAGTFSSSAGSPPARSTLWGFVVFSLTVPVDVAHSAPTCPDAKPDHRHSCRLPGGSQRLWSSSSCCDMGGRRRAHGHPLPHTLTSRAHLSSGTAPALPQKCVFAISRGEVAGDKHPHFAHQNPSALRRTCARAAALSPLPLRDAACPSL